MIDGHVKNTLLVILFSCFFLQGTPLYKKLDINECNSDIENQLKGVALSAFKIVYADLWCDSFEQKGLENIDNLIAHYKQSNDDQAWVVCLIKGKVVGWALFFKQREYNRAILEQVSVHPDFWRQGIGKDLVFLIKDFWPDIGSIVLASRRSNIISHLFYDSLGFLKSDFSLPRYEGKDMQGYIYTFYP